MTLIHSFFLYKSETMRVAVEVLDAWHPEGPEQHFVQPVHLLVSHEQKKKSELASVTTVTSMTNDSHYKAISLAAVEAPTRRCKGYIDMVRPVCIQLHSVFKKADVAATMLHCSIVAL
jgi:hypothetical protein